MNTKNFFISKFVFIIGAFAFTLWETITPLDIHAAYSALFDYSKFGHENRKIFEAVFLMFFLFYSYHAIRYQKTHINFKIFYYLATIFLTFVLFLTILVKDDCKTARILIYCVFILTMLTIDLIIWGKKETTVDGKAQEKNDLNSSPVEAVEEFPLGIC